MTQQEILEAITIEGRLDTNEVVWKFDAIKLAAFLHEQEVMINKLSDCVNELGLKLQGKPTPSVKADGGEKEGWQPRLGEEYWFIQFDGTPCGIEYMGGDMLVKKRYSGVYRTEKEAQDMADKIKFFVRSQK